MNIYDNYGHVSELVSKQPDIIKARCGKPPEINIKSLPYMNSLLWGFSKRTLVTIGARPSNGKSNMMLQLAYDCADQGLITHFYSFEMTLQTCAARIFSRLCEVDNYLIRTGNYKYHEERYKDKVEQVNRRLKIIPLLIFQTVGKSLPELSEIHTKIKPKPDVVFIDYGNMVSPQEFKSRKNVYDDYIKGLRSMAINNDLCIIMGAQINRNVQQKGGTVRPPELEDFKETGVLEEASDVCILLHWGNFYDKELPFNEYSVRIAKNREGRTGKIPALFYPEMSMIKEDEGAIREIKERKALSGRA
jgi:replicative DNA helicase